MAENTLGLLFEISADPSKAERALERFRTHTTAQTNSVRSDFQMVARDLAAWGSGFQGQLSLAQGALAGLGQTAALTFERFAQGMGMNMTVALAYSKSIGEAMSRSLKATATTIAAEAVIQTLRSLGLGFYLLALGDFTGSANAFKSAAVWGSIGGIAGAAAGAAPGAGASSGPAGNASASLASGDARNTSAAAFASAQRTLSGNLTVMVMGQPQAARWLTQVINAGVEQHDLRLVASHTKRPAPAAR